MDIQILTYDQVDPLEVWHLNQVALEYSLTPERAALIRRLDPRPFPFFALYAAVDGVLAGQVCVYRLPVVTVDGPEEMGGISAVCTHPDYARQGIAARLMEEAHAHIRQAGMRFSTLGTSSHRGAYHLYRSLGYEDAARLGMATASRETAVRLGSLTARQTQPGEISLADDFYQRLAPGKIGFTRRLPGFLSTLIAMGEIGQDSIWLINFGSDACGFTRVIHREPVLHLNDILLAEEASPAEATAALVRGTQADYISLETFQRPVLDNLAKAGYRI